MMPKPRIYIDKVSTCLKFVMRDMDYVRMDKPRDADLVWTRKPFVYQWLNELQLYNHIPNEYEIVHKGALAKNLASAPENTLNASSRSFYPETYRLYIEKEKQVFFKNFTQSADNDSVWLLKPSRRSKGKGIKILSDEEVRTYVKKKSIDGIFQGNINYDKYVIQRYIKDVLLLNDRKSEIRVYWLIASLNPLIVLIYREGTVRLCFKPLHFDDLNDISAHVTNVYQQKKQAGFDADFRLKWSFSALGAYLREKNYINNDDYIENILMEKIKQALAFTVRAAYHRLCIHPDTGLFFGLYGADFIVDKQLNPRLTEVQRGPGLSYSDPIKRDIITGMLREAFAILLEIQAKKRNNASLDVLESVKNYQYIIAPAPHTMKRKTQVELSS